MLKMPIWMTRFAVVPLGYIAFIMATGLASPLEAGKKTDPLKGLTKKWDVKLIVIGGDDPLGSFLSCGSVKVASPTDRAVSFSAACENAGDYYFRLAQDSETQDFFMTVKSRIGLSLDDCPVTYDGQRWHGAGDQLIDGETLSVTASVEPIEGRNWYGWRIQVFPTAALDYVSPDEFKEPYLMADLTRRK